MKYVYVWTYTRIDQYTSRRIGNRPRFPSSHILAAKLQMKKIWSSMVFVMLVKCIVITFRSVFRYIHYAYLHPKWRSLSCSFLVCNCDISCACLCGQLWCVPVHARGPLLNPQWRNESFFSKVHVATTDAGHQVETHQTGQHGHGPQDQGAMSITCGRHQARWGRKQQRCRINTNNAVYAQHNL